MQTDGCEAFPGVVAMNCLLEGLSHNWPMCLKVFSRRGHSLLDRQQLPREIIHRGVCGALLPLHLHPCPCFSIKILDSFDPVNMHMYSISTPSLCLDESSSNLSVPDITEHLQDNVHITTVDT